MAGGEFFLLGALMGARLLSARRRAAAALATRLPLTERALNEVIVRLFVESYLDGVDAAVIAHGSRLGITRAGIQNEMTRGLTERVITAVGIQRTRLLDQFEDEGTTVAQFVSRAIGSVQNTVWAGQDDEAQVLAALATVEWKTWVRAFARDEARDHHDDLNGVSIPVDDDFILPGGNNVGARCYGPRDWDSVGDPGEWMNCGHALEFKREATRVDVEITVRNLETVYAPRRTTP